jgi:membrane protein YdbS with pleckstrin-like domain
MNYLEIIPLYSLIGLFAFYFIIVGRKMKISWLMFIAALICGLYSTMIYMFIFIDQFNYSKWRAERLNKDNSNE